MYSIRFKDIKGKSVHGSDVYFQVTALGVEFFEKALRMPKTNPISFTDIFNMMMDESTELSKQGKHKEAVDLMQYVDFCDYAANKGFHIEFKDDEYEILGFSASA